jgi:MFS superfamily sulfate permease-like transporter/CRP-like cAMP-binding protein
MPIIRSHVARTSSFVPLEIPGEAQERSLRSTLTGAADGLAFSLPVSLGCVTLIFSHIGLELLPAGVFALLLAMAWIHLTTALDRRPVLFGARFFEATTLAAMLQQMIGAMPGWGLQNTTGTRLALFCLVGAAAGIAAGALYLLHADRFTRLIPSPVFVGFSNSIAVALFVSQSRALGDLVANSATVAPAVTIAAVVLATAMALRYLRPRWPATTIALAIGLALGLLWLAAGHPTPTIGAFGWTSVLPVSLADFGSLQNPKVQNWQVAAAILTNGAILGAMIFINTTMSAEMMAQLDGRRQARGAARLVPAIGITLAGMIGSAPLSGSMNASMIAARRATLSSAMMLVCGVLVAGVYFSGVVGLVPLAAISAGLLCEAWFLMDRKSLGLLRDWLLKRPVAANGREDLALIVTVTASAVILNMVAAVFVGLLFGLIVFAARNARRPVRNLWTGAQLTSNCARSRGDLRLLAEHGPSIHIVELDGDLFFGAVDSLERGLDQSLQGATGLVIDWSRVRHIDTSVVGSFVQFERRAHARGVAPIHAGCGNQPELAAVLMQHLPHLRQALDLDRALEQAENDVLLLRGDPEPTDKTGMMESASLFTGMDAEERSVLESAMPQKVYRTGEVILQAGDPGDELLIVLQGSGNVVLPQTDGTDVRLAGVRGGATLGDIAFLDRTRRSATVIAAEDTTVAILRRETYDEICITHPRLVQILLTNIALNLAVRLRHTNRLALSRQSSA